MSSERIVLTLLVVLASACADPCVVLVDKVCGPVENGTRACDADSPCRDAKDLRETTVTPACSAALDEEERYPRCPSCVKPERTVHAPFTVPNLAEPECTSEEPWNWR